MVYWFETFRINTEIVHLKCLKVLHLYLSFQINFISHQIWKIGSFNYARFPKSGHILNKHIIMYICTETHTHRKTHTFIHMHTYICTYMHMCTHICTHKVKQLDLQLLFSWMHLSSWTRMLACATHIDRQLFLAGVGWRHTYILGYLLAIQLTTLSHDN